MSPAGPSRKGQTVHLVDALPYVFRAYYSLPESITDPRGAPVNAVRGFGDFLVRYLTEERPTHLAAAFDESLTTSFRNELYPDYKAQRELPPPELERQLTRCKQLAEALGASVFADDRYEADDLIATLCRRLVRRGHRVQVVTSDKDLAQLVGERVVLYDFAKGDRYGPRDVRRKFGVHPEQIPDYLGLAGDAVDNIPGVRGVGAKTAVELLTRFDGLEALYAGLEEVAGLPIRGAAGIARRLAEQEREAFLSRELATVSYRAPASARLRELAWRGADAALLDPLLDELGFGRLRDRVPRWKAGRRP